MNISEQATVELKKVLDNIDQPGAGIHIFSTQGCCGPSIQMDVASQAAKEETVINLEGIDFFVEKSLLPSLESVTIEHTSNGFRLAGLERNSSGCCG